MSAIGNDIRKVEAWFAKVFKDIEADASKISVFITAKLDSEIEKFISDGAIIAAEKVVDVVTNSNVGDVIGRAIIAEWPKIVQTAKDVQALVGGIPIIKTMIAAQIRAIINSEIANPEPLNWATFIKDGEIIFADLISDIRSQE